MVWPSTTMGATNEGVERTEETFPAREAMPEGLPCSP